MKANPLLPATRPTILVVDDQPANISVIVALLRSRYRVKAARSGRRGLDIAAADPAPDLILLDVVMPEMDGYEVCRRLKADPKTADIPIIFLTALDTDQSEARGLEMGAADFVTKPFNAAVVRARVRTQLELVHERRLSDRLLANTLPARVVADLKTRGSSPPQEYRDVSLLFIDMIDFTRIAGQLEPAALMAELTAIFSGFDAIVEAWGGQTIKTIGDAYFCVCGMPDARPDHALRIIEIALGFIDFLAERNRTAEHRWEARVGVHSGPVIAGIVGRTRYLYDVFGDAVNIAARVERASWPMRLTVTGTTRDAVPAGAPLEFVPRGPVALKGKGALPLFFVDRRPG